MSSVLLISDDKFLAEILKKKIEDAGFSFLHALTGEEGVEMAEEQRPDAIVMGIALSRKNGFEILEELKSKEATAEMPIFMYSALGSREDVQRCMEAGAHTYLIRSHHTPEDVTRCVRTVLREKPGFTLREMLIVMGIIFLAGLLALWQFRVYQKNREALYPPVPVLQQGEQATSTPVNDEGGE